MNATLDSQRFSTKKVNDTKCCMKFDRINQTSLILAFKQLVILAITVSFKCSQIRLVANIVGGL